MFAYIVRKILYGILVLWGVATLVFFLFTIVPGDPVRMMLGQRADENDVQAIRHELGLDQSPCRQSVMSSVSTKVLVNNTLTILTTFRLSRIKTAKLC